ncbi:MAG: DMT family transporter [Anaerolineae bacterium]|nr:DMT family transporter [Anaerolineae bacterium]
MAALIGTIIAFVTFGVVLKLLAVHHQPPTPVAFVNYAFAAAVTGTLALLSPESAGGPPVWVLGGVAGAAFVSGFFLNHRAVQQVGLSVAQPIASLAVALPILASVVLWNERPTPAQVAAVLVVCPALVLLGSANPGSQPPPAASQSRLQPGDRTGPGPAGDTPLPGAVGGGRRTWGTLVALFLVQGAVMLAPKALEELGYGGYRWGYLGVLFTVAAAGAGLRWSRTREELTPRLAWLGVVFGTANVAATVLLLAALGSLPGIVVYPATSVGSMVLAGVVGITVWSERPGRRALAGMALAVPSVFLLSA